MPFKSAVQSAYDLAAAKERHAFLAMLEARTNISEATLPHCLEALLDAERAWKQAKAERDVLTLLALRQERTDSAASRRIGVNRAGSPVEGAGKRQLRWSQ